jgi:hypothetical protein
MTRRKIREDFNQTARLANHFGFAETAVKRKISKNQKYFAFTEGRTVAYWLPSRPDQRGVS